MKLYSIYSKLLNSESYIELMNRDRSEIQSYFLYDEGELTTKPKFRGQEGFSTKNIKLTDKYDSIDSLLVFSADFYEKMRLLLEDEMQFSEAELTIGGEIINCYIGKITNIQSILNEEESEYDEWLGDEDEPFVETPVFMKEIRNTVHCAKNTSRQYIVAFTELFKQQVEQNGLKIDFQEVKQ
ncbi:MULTISPECIES: hypothetical protein [Actinomycetes]|uniref:hypothetical protein n=1 Tax=Actinomycetes TaxID=1760 RepID=UPI0008C71227|nr:MULTISPECIES: hypothetical protein [Actinomycetes]MCG7266664.1 hypothetical protein [Corynebacterium sp. ACRQJ]OFT35975.1 hypothetical protein HMPREF3166_02095 [Corynebacterium sp. HMSC08A12]